MKQTLKIGITVLVVAALGVSGVALAAQTTEDDSTAVEDTRAYKALEEKLAPLVEDGTITQSQADVIAATLAADMPGRPGRGPGHRPLQGVAGIPRADPPRRCGRRCRSTTRSPISPRPTARVAPNSSPIWSARSRSTSQRAWPMDGSRKKRPTRNLPRPRSTSPNW